VTTDVTASQLTDAARIEARPAGFLRDLATVARRALRSIPREPESIIPALVVPVFFFVVNTGSLGATFEGLAAGGGPGGPPGSGLPDGFNYEAFQLPVAIIFAVTGVSRAAQLVTDIQSGYFDRLSVTPVNRLALLLGLMVADFALVVGLTLPVLGLGFLYGVTFETGVLGALVFVLLGGLWGLVFTGFPYAIALRTGSPAAVNSSFILFFPFAFLTTAFAPEEALTGWLATVADFNPVTYLLEALRSLLYGGGWDAGALLRGLAAILGVGVLTQTLSLSALRARTSRGG
jgi:ABC-2 type transport system permease protein